MSLQTRRTIFSPVEHKILNFKNVKDALFCSNKNAWWSLSSSAAIMLIYNADLRNTWLWQWLVSRCIQRSHISKYSLLPMAMLYIWPLFCWNTTSFMSLVSHHRLFLSYFKQTQLVSPCLVYFSIMTGWLDITSFLFLSLIHSLARLFVRSLICSFTIKYVHCKYAFLS